MSVARAFGARDYSVALIARRRDALDAMVAELDGAGISAATTQIHAPFELPRAAA